MHPLQRLSTFSTEDLKKRKNLHQIALGIVWFGIACAIGAALSRLINDGFIAYELLYGVFFAFTASIPVYIQKKRIVAVLRSR